MTELPQRPKFYLHRSRRFWNGLALLFILSAWLMAAWFQPFKITFGNWNSYSSWRGDMLDSVSITQMDGGLILCLEEYRNPFYGVAAIATWKSEFEKLAPFSSSSHYGFSPDCSTSKGSWGSSREVFVPIWLLIAVWAILWPLWIRRGDKLEEKRFQSINRLQAAGTEPPCKESLHR
jgi:hypothetical protein